MSTTFYNTFSITISYGQNFGAFSATKSIPKGDFGFPKFGCLQLKVRDEKNLPVLKTTSGSTKIWVHLKIIADMERTECVPKDDFGPA